MPGGPNRPPGSGRPSRAGPKPSPGSGRPSAAGPEPPPGWGRPVEAGPNRRPDWGGPRRPPGSGRPARVRPTRRPLGRAPVGVADGPGDPTCGGESVAERRGIAAPAWTTAAGDRGLGWSVRCGAPAHPTERTPRKTPQAAPARHEGGAGEEASEGDGRDPWGRRRPKAGPPRTRARQIRDPALAGRSAAPRALGRSAGRPAAAACARGQPAAELVHHAADLQPGVLDPHVVHLRVECDNRAPDSNPGDQLDPARRVEPGGPQGGRLDRSGPQLPVQDLLDSERARDRGVVDQVVDRVLAHGDHAGSGSSGSTSFCSALWPTHNATPHSRLASATLKIGQLAVPNEWISHGASDGLWV